MIFINSDLFKNIPTKNDKQNFIIVIGLHSESCQNPDALKQITAKGGK